MKNKKLLIALAALVVVIAAMLTIYFVTLPETSAGEKTCTITVIHCDETTKTFTVTTNEEYLGAALEKEGIISSQGADPGMFHTVDGEKADWNVNQSYWAFYVGEEYASKGIYETPVTDGGSYKLVYTIG